MDGRSRTAIATFFADAPLQSVSTVTLSDDAAQHARVRRLAPGDSVRLTNGRGSIGEGTLERLTKATAVVALSEVAMLAAPPSLRIFLPVADRERMLWLAEKCAELGVSMWQPVIFRRSLSVSPRGEGEKFAEKVRARMVAALEQSAGAWLPEIHREHPLEEALVRAGDSIAERYLLERGGAPLVETRPRSADVLIGPEGGIEEDERALIVESHHWRPASLGDTTLRFETAGMVAAGMLRALLAIA